MFPGNDSVKQQWIHAIRRVANKQGASWTPKPYMLVCKEHFAETDYEMKETIYGKFAFI